MASAQPAQSYAQGDVLRHHSVVGFYHVLGVEPTGRILVLTPEGYHRTLAPDYVRENFTAVDHG